jgi:hypothetical protein
MLTIENVETYGWAAAIRGMRNPKNSWDKMDSHPCLEADWSGDCAMVMNDDEPAKDCDPDKYHFCVGENDFKLMQTLAAAGQDHGKFLRMITVTLDITAPLYWWKEFDTYKVGTVANSCSTMHKIHAKEFDVNDFSHEHVEELTGDDYNMSYDFLLRTVDILNYYRKKFLETNDKKYWWQLIQLLPSSFNQRRTVQLNYAVLKNIYHARKDHKLDEWHTLCDWIESLPYSELITGRH